MASDTSRRTASTSVVSLIPRLLALSTLFAFPVAGAWDEWRAPESAPILPYAPSPRSSDQPQEQRFTLRHVFHRGTKLYPNLHRRLDINPEKVREASVWEEPGDDDIGPYDTHASSVRIPRLRERSAEHMLPLMHAAQVDGIRHDFPDSAWSLDEVQSPNVTDKGTVVNFALMAASAYQKDRSGEDWEDTRPPFNLSSDIGWENDGIRGHVFADKDNSTIVIAIKGTSMAVFDGIETTTSDKENDNLFAGCCCGQGGSYLLRQVCDCMTSAYTCNDTCVTKALRKPNRYYQSSLELYGNITEMYPNASVWVTGHSLGGLVASLVGMTFGIPAVTFESIPQALAAERLSLPVPPGYSSIVEARKHSGLYNFGHTADPVYMGACNGGTSLCSIGGYALQSQCHAGLRCVYDVVDDRKWRMSLATHGIRKCISNVYRDYDTVPKCVPDDECVDCFNWKRFHSNGSETTTKMSSSSSTSSTTATRTSTCKTPGWWGCRDETSTSSTTLTTTSSVSTTSTSTTTITTATCSSYGWFGNCLDPITTTTTSTTTLAPPKTTSHSTSTTGTCETPGWWGCKDPTSTTSTGHAITSPPQGYEL